MSTEPKSYWRVARVIFVLLAIYALFTGLPTMAAVWLACSLVCHATRDVLDAIERR